MTKFKRAFLPEPTDGQVNGMAKNLGETEDSIRALMANIKDTDIVYMNDKYQVNVRTIEAPEGPPEPPMAHLSIKRRDKKPIHDWRDLQDIKNEICGKEVEGVELYPAESRLVDTANQYHLWVIIDETFRWPIGFNERLVINTSGGGAVQRPRKDL